MAPYAEPAGQPGETADPLREMSQAAQLDARRYAIYIEEDEP